MPKPLYRRHWAWIGGMQSPPEEIMPDVESARFSLSGLADRGLLSTRQLADFQDETGLADLAWRVSWNRTALAEAGGDFRSLMRRTQGFIIFMHGWCGSTDVWEHLPALTCAANPRLVALVPDLNGFGMSPFLTEVPALDQCDPHAVMQVMVYWVELLRLRSDRRTQRRRNVITFVGHSTGGAALFYFREQDWHENEVARCALAPMLLINDELRLGFYRELGVPSWAKKPVDEFKSRMTRQVLENLLGSVGEDTLADHLRIFETTPRGTLAQTFYAMVVRLRELRAQGWRNFGVILSHDDRLLNVSQMLRLLDDLGLAPHQVHVVKGGHYLFSRSKDDDRIQRRNREIILGEILYLHEACREKQRS